MVFLSYFLCRKHFENLGSITVNSRGQQTLLKLLTRYFEDQKEGLGLCLQPVAVTLMSCFLSLHNQIGLFHCVVMERVAAPPKCMQIVSRLICVSAYWERRWKYCQKSGFDHKTVFLCLLYLSVEQPMVLNFQHTSEEGPLTELEILPREFVTLIRWLFRLPCAYLYKTLPCRYRNKTPLEAYTQPV